MKRVCLIILLLTIVVDGFSQDSIVSEQLQTCLINHLNNNRILKQHPVYSTDTAYVLFSENRIKTSFSVNPKDSSVPCVMYLTRKSANALVKERKSLYVHLITEELVDSNSSKIHICLMHGEVKRLRWWQFKKVWFGNTGICSRFDITDGVVSSNYSFTY